MEDEGGAEFGLCAVLNCSAAYFASGSVPDININARPGHPRQGQWKQIIGNKPIRALSFGGRVPLSNIYINTE